MGKVAFVSSEVDLNGRSLAWAICDNVRRDGHWAVRSGMLGQISVGVTEGNRDARRSAAVRENVVDGERLVGVFSGDTIIDQEYWGETELFRVWGEHVYELSERTPYASVYWFLITSGYKTYRFLPIFLSLGFAWVSQSVQ